MADNKRETLMRKIQMYGFTAHECALYLDCHPDNRKALELHKKSVEMMKEATAQYEELYGPITANSANVNQNAGWSWVYGKWPWQNKEDDK